MSNPTSRAEQIKTVYGRNTNRLSEFFGKLKDGFSRSVNRKPAYRITENGIEVDYFNFDNPKSLPFDIETYNDCNLFLGDYANPWHVDLDAIESEYEEFGSGDPITDLVEKKHVMPSQKYKTYMNQNVLQSTFSFGGLEFERLKYIAYMILGGVAINLVITLT